MKIHDTAIVDEKARLGAEGEIGPYSIVGAEVIICEKCVIQSHVVIEWPVKMGPGNFLGHVSIIGPAPQPLGFQGQPKSESTIGNAYLIRIP